MPQFTDLFFFNHREKYRNWNLNGGLVGQFSGLSACASNPNQAQGTMVQSSDPPLRQLEPAKKNKKELKPEEWERSSVVEHMLTISKGLGLITTTIIKVWKVPENKTPVCCIAAVLVHPAEASHHLTVFLQHRFKHYCLVLFLLYWRLNQGL